MSLPKIGDPRVRRVRRREEREKMREIAHEARRRGKRAQIVGPTYLDPRHVRAVHALAQTTGLDPGALSLMSRKERRKLKAGVRGVQRAAESLDRLLHRAGARRI